MSPPNSAKAAEQIKIHLDVQEAASVDLLCLTSRNGHFIDITLKLTHKKLDLLFSGLILRTLGPCQQALRDAGLTASELKEVILVGGMSRMPGLRRRVAETFNRQPKTGIDPSRIVAQGAAIQAGVLSGLVKDSMLLDVIPLSLGIASCGDKFERIIDRNTTFPTLKSVRFTLHQPPVKVRAERLQPAVFTPRLDSNVITIYQGERDIASDNLYLAEILLDDTSFRAGDEISVSFDIDANARIRVSAKNERTGEEREKRIEASDPFARSQGVEHRQQIRFSDEHIATARAQAEELLNVVDAAVAAHGPDRSLRYPSSDRRCKGWATACHAEPRCRRTRRSDQRLLCRCRNETARPPASYCALLRRYERIDLKPLNFHQLCAGGWRSKTRAMPTGNKA
jgi:molecular chaperone DnaK